MIKEIQRNMDYPLLISVILLMVCGVLMIHSAGTSEIVDSSTIWIKQLVWVFLSLFVIALIIPIPFRFFYVFAYIFYGLGILLLILTELFGTRGGNSERWLAVGSLRLQPSEFMKVAVILTMARFLSLKKNRPYSFFKLLVPTLIIAVPLVLVLLQPDLGTALVFSAVIFPMLYWAGLGESRLFLLVSPVLSAILTAPFIPFFHPVMWVVFMFAILAVLFYARYSLPAMGSIISINVLAGIAMPLVFNHLKPYQQERITTLFNPEADPLGSAYQIINSMVAIGSGGIFGKGIGNGRYTELGFLPNAHTDFIFSVIGEELGFIGAVGVLLLLFILIYRALTIAAEVKSPFSSIAAVGFASVFAFHMFVNIGMVVGIMPVTGLPLPFLSYGGSSLLANAVMIGLLLNFIVHRYDY